MQTEKRKSSAKMTHKYLLAAVSVAATLLLLTVAFTNPIIAWFKSILTVNNPAQLTNFTVDSRYSFDGGSTWTTLSPGAAIPVTPDNINNLQIRVRYCGIAAHYLRVSFFGGFYNKNTSTYLPLDGDSQAALFTATGTNWVTSGDYVYYTTMLKDQEELTNLDILKVTADTSSWANKSDYQDYAGELYVLVDAVQCNRIQEFWGISSPPTA